MRNQNSRFATNPIKLDISRSKFVRNSTVKTSFSAGTIVPFYLDEVLPGDTFNVKTSKLVRTQTLITPLMDNIYLDTYYFYVPLRLTWEHFKNFMGEPESSPWLPTTTYSIPQITAPSGGWNVGTIADHLGLPTGLDNISVSSLPFRAYALICDQWFRNENVQSPINVPLDDTTIAGSNGTDQVTDIVKGGALYKANKFKDQFTAVLPAPQRGPSVSLPGLTGTADVITSKINHADKIKYPLSWSSGTNQYASSDQSLVSETFTHGTQSPNIMTMYDYANNDINFTAIYGSNPWNTGTSKGWAPDNLVIDTGVNAPVTITELRQAFQLQKYYEQLSRSGNRYTEVIAGMFSVQSPDARLQRSEYLGGNRCRININSVIQSSATVSGQTPQGNLTAYSQTVDTHNDFTKSFTEHGYVIGVMVCRYDHSYQQGIERHWKRSDTMDFYWPTMANISEVGVKNSEIYAQGSTVLNPNTGKAYDDEIFGYQEAWYEYRYKPNTITGMMRSSATNSLDSWHLGDDYNSLPSYSASWVVEDPSNLDRALAVSHTTADQLFADLYIENTTTRPMPMYSIPGLIDHH